MSVLFSSLLSFFTSALLSEKKRSFITSILKQQVDCQMGFELKGGRLQRKSRSFAAGVALRSISGRAECAAHLRSKAQEMAEYQIHPEPQDCCGFGSECRP